MPSEPKRKTGDTKPRAGKEKKKIRMGKMKIQSLDSVRGKRIHMHFDKSNSSIKSFFYSLFNSGREREKKKSSLV